VKDGYLATPAIEYTAPVLAEVSVLVAIPEVVTSDEDVHSDASRRVCVFVVEYVCFLGLGAVLLKPEQRVRAATLVASVLDEVGVTLKGDLLGTLQPTRHGRL